MMKPPGNFASIVESSDDVALLDLLVSPKGILYEYDHLLLANVMCRLKSTVHLHRFIHARLVVILQRQTSVCAKLLDVFPSTRSVGCGGVEFLLAELLDNFYLYSLLVEAFVVDFDANGRKSRMFKLVHSLDGRPSVKALGKAIMKPFINNLSFAYKQCAVKLFAIVAACNGIKVMAETAISLFVDERQFILFVRHLKLDQAKLSFLHEYLLEKRMVKHSDLTKCPLSLDDTIVSKPIKDELVWSACFLQTNKELAQEMLKQIEK